jgi:RNA polymerase sigma-70 factor (ECF subfamily)
VPDATIERELMSRYCDGDAEAFRRLYALTAPRIFSFLHRVIGDRAAAEDLLQQTFLKVHEARAVYVREADPMPWMYAIARRTFLDEVRRRRRARVHLTHGGTLPVEPRAGLSGQPEASGATEVPLRTGNPTLAALADLPQNQREALVLTKLHGRTVTEAALIAGTSAGAIKQRAHRAYITLRKVLQGERP